MKKIILSVIFICLIIIIYRVFILCWELNVYRYGSYEQVREIFIPHYYSVNKDKLESKLWCGNTPLQEMAEYGNIDGIKFVFDAVDDECICKLLSHKNKQGETAIDIAIKQVKPNDRAYHYEVYNFLLASKVLTDIRENDVTDNQIIDSIKKNNIAINKQWFHGETILNKAIRFKRLQLVNYLLENGASSNIFIFSATDFMMTCKFYDFNIINKLIQYGAEPNMVDKDNKNSLYYWYDGIRYHSCTQEFFDKKIDILKLLISNGASYKIKDIDGKTFANYISEVNSLSAEQKNMIYDIIEY